jgi:hypothetical protein
MFSGRWLSSRPSDFHPWRTSTTAEEAIGTEGELRFLELAVTSSPMSRLKQDSLVTLALTILEEQARAALAVGKFDRPPWLRIVLAWLFTVSRGERGFFENYWSALVSPNEIGRQQGLNASLNGIYRQLGRERQA